MKKNHPGRLRAIIGSNIRRHRKERGLSQQDFALEINMDRTYFAGVERGERNVSLDNIERIADGLGVEPFVLLRNDA
ncbi:helix-turn-helix domain-containing protein [Aquamicrobium sp. NLF2-7]|uniref:helix-turn-helix domain-containing protein n=1 Tax=Aquamicrobium sp. NLF2-7 TaxID=2918753 RepID=UPI001EFA564B|nr:helix-turn-helix domain-containing protein [Aquamicrobium sp. NLF2-7]